MSSDASSRAVRDIQLEKLVHRVIKPYSEVRFQDLGLSYNGDTLLEMYGTLCAEALKPDVKDLHIQVQIPLNWFQQFKKECFPRWLLRKFPVKYKDLDFRYEIVVKALFPKLHISFPREMAIPRISIFAKRDEDVMGRADVIIRNRT